MKPHACHLIVQQGHLCKAIALFPDKGAWQLRDMQRMHLGGRATGWQKARVVTSFDRPILR